MTRNIEIRIGNIEEILINIKFALYVIALSLGIIIGCLFTLIGSS